MPLFVLVLASGFFITVFVQAGLWRNVRKRIAGGEREILHSGRSHFGVVWNQHNTELSILNLRLSGAVLYESSMGLSFCASIGMCGIESGQLGIGGLSLPVLDVA